MQGQPGCSPDVVTYTALISAFEKGGQWRLALSAYERMRCQGCKADAIVFNAIIDALWETGVVWVQRRALKLFRWVLALALALALALVLVGPHCTAGLRCMCCAPRSRLPSKHTLVCAPRPLGPPPVPPTSPRALLLLAVCLSGWLACRVAIEEGHFHQGKLVPGLARAEVNLHAMTAGVAQLSLYAWLVSLKQLLAQHGTGAPRCCCCCRYRCSALGHVQVLPRLHWEAGGLAPLS